MPEPFFFRFRWKDPGDLAREIDDARAAVDAAVKAGDTLAELDETCRLATALTAADREAEAVALLEPLLLKARALGNAASLSWILLTQGTARQYLGQHDRAQDMFAEALQIAQTNTLIDVEHYVWHHRGRCFAEQKDIARARHAFERALAIRLQLGEPRAERSREALAALDSLV